jgi:hypothetical protein
MTVVMTAEDAKALGYEVIAASPFEVGLVKNGKGLRTWWCKTFEGKLPPLDHPIIMEHIAIQESLEAELSGQRPPVRQAARNRTPLNGALDLLMSFKNWPGIDAVLKRHRRIP